MLNGLNFNGILLGMLGNGMDILKQFTRYVVGVPSDYAFDML